MESMLRKIRPLTLEWEQQILAARERGAFF
jgi:hypothetical protein